MLESNLTKWSTLFSKKMKEEFCRLRLLSSKETLKYKSLRIISQFNQTFAICCVESGFLFCSRCTGLAVKVKCAGFAHETFKHRHEHFQRPLRLAKRQRKNKRRSQSQELSDIKRNFDQIHLIFYFRNWQSRWQNHCRTTGSTRVDRKRSFFSVFSKTNNVVWRDYFSCIVYIAIL